MEGMLGRRSLGAEEKKKKERSSDSIESIDLFNSESMNSSEFYVIIVVGE